MADTAAVSHNFHCWHMYYIDIYMNVRYISIYTWWKKKWNREKPFSYLYIAKCLSIYCSKGGSTILKRLCIKCGISTTCHLNKWNGSPNVRVTKKYFFLLMEKWKSAINIILCIRIVYTYERIAEFKMLFFLLFF